MNQCCTFRKIVWSIIKFLLLTKKKITCNSEITLEILKILLETKVTKFKIKSKLLYIVVATIFTFLARAIYDWIFQLKLCHHLFLKAKYSVWHSLAQFPVAHDTMLQFQLTLKQIIDGTGKECKNDCNKVKIDF